MLRDPLFGKLLTREEAGREGVVGELLGGSGMVVVRVNVPGGGVEGEKVVVEGALGVGAAQGLAVEAEDTALGQ